MAASKARRLGGEPTPDPTPDDALVRAFVQGDADAFPQLFYRHRDVLGGAAMNLTCDFGLGEELARRAMVRVFRAKRTPRGKLPLRLRLLRGLVRESRRFHWRRALLRAVGLRPTLRSKRILPVHRLELPQRGAEGRRRKATLRALAGLSLKLREVVALCDLEGLTYEETAAVLRLSTRAVGLRLGRARLRFTAAFQRHMRRLG